VQEFAKNLKSMRSTRPWIIVSMSVVLLLIGLYYIYSRVNSGFVVFDDNNPKEVQEILKLHLENYSKFIDFIVTSFGAVAFLITYQMKSGAIINSRSWALLMAGLVMLAGSLIFCFLGREQLLAMVAHNAIDFTLPGLRYGRWFSYICLVSAALLVGFFTLEVALSPKKDPPISTD
jgi:hypothetical protein